MAFIFIATWGSLYYYNTGQNYYKLGQLLQISAQQVPLNLVKNVYKSEFKISKKNITFFSVSVSLRVVIN